MRDDILGDAGVVFVADDLGAWLIEVLADSGRRKLTGLILGTDQERALRSAARTAIQRTAAELLPANDDQAGHLVMVISEVFSEAVPSARMTGQETLLEELRAGIGAQLAVLNDASLTGTGTSSAEVLGIPAKELVETLTGQLIREIIVRGSQDGPLFQLASQINHDVTHLQNQRLETMVGEVAEELRQLLARVDVTPAAVAAPPALAELPSATARITGRSNELAALAELLRPTQAEGAVFVSAVVGMAGVGKTALAVRAGHMARQRGWFAGGALFVDMHGYDEVPVQPGQALDSLLRALGVPPEHIPPGTEQRAGLYRSILAQTEEQVLLVIDNVSSEAQVRPLLPGAGPHKTLITSRHKLAALDAALVDIAELDDVASTELLDSALRTARPGDDRISRQLGETAQLAMMCEGLPLALQIIAAMLKADPILSVSVLVEELRAEQVRLEKLRYDDGSSRQMSVEAAFRLSYRKLNTATARMFRLLPVNPGTSLSVAAVAALSDLPVSEARPLLSGLVQAHLAEPAPGTGSRWRMHDLVRLYAQRLSDDHADADHRERARDRLLDYYLQTAVAADYHIRALPRMAVPAPFTDRDMALEWLDSERAGLVAAVSMAAEKGRDEIALKLPTALFEYFAWRRRFDDALTTATISLQAARRLGDGHAEGMALNHYGLALANLRRFSAAITACQDAAAALRETGDRKAEGMAQFNLGMALSGERRFDEAIAAYRRDLEICSETDDRDGTAITLDALGDTLRQSRAFDDALAAHQSAAAIFRATGNRHGEGTALLNVAVVLIELLRFDEALLGFGQAAALLRETGDQHRLGAISLNTGAVLSRLQRFDEAVTAGEDALAVFREMGDRHSEGRALLNIGAALNGAGRLQEAIGVHREAVASFRETGDRRIEGIALNYLGSTMLQSQLFDEAIVTYQSAVVVFREVSDRHLEGTTLSKLGAALGETGKVQEAIAVCQNAIAALQEVDDRHDMAVARCHLGSALQLAGATEEAVAEYRSAVGLFRDTGSHRDEGGALTDLAHVLRQAERGEEALAAYKGAALAYRETNDRRSEGFALNDWGMALMQSNRFDEAIKPYQNALSAFRDAGDRRGEGIVLNDLGNSLRQTGDAQAAISAYREAAAIFLEIDRQQEAASAQYNLGMVLLEIGCRNEAIAAFQDAVTTFREIGDQEGERIALDGLQAVKRTKRHWPFLSK